MSQENAVSYSALLRGNRNFRLLWLGQIVSLTGDWFNLIASAALIADLTQSGTAIGSLFVVRMLAPFLVSPMAGVVADRYNRKHILLATDLLRAVVVLGFLVVRSAEQVWLLYVLTAVQLGISGFYFPTRNAILPDLVSRPELGAANAISAATWSTMLALGAALGGLVAGLWGNQPAFVIDGLTFVISAYFLSRIVYQPPISPESSDKTVRGALRQYLDGLRYMQKQLDILIIALHKPAIALLITTGFQVIQVRIAEQVFVMGKGGGISLGIMYGVVGIGTGLGPILARYFTGDRDRSLRTAIIFGYLLSAVGLLIAAPLTNFYILQFGILLRGIGAGTVWVFSTQLLLQLTPNQVRGRVFATEYAIFTLMSAISAAVTGPAMDIIGISGLLAWMASLSLLPMVLWMLWVVRRQPQVVEGKQWGD
jgi:MFS family permease